ncbi:MAG: YfhO family protein [Oscillospiraceae bacterium]|nr:YfhO family protein [Oscillospiraceae bacterium]
MQNSDITDIENKRRAVRGMALFSFLMPAAVILIVCLSAGVYPFGELSLLSEFSGEWISELNTLREVINGKGGISYIFFSGLGEDFFMRYSAYLVSPINLLAVFFDERSMLTAYLIIVCIKTGLAGFTSYILVAELSSKKVEISLALSVAYAGCSGTLLALFAPQLLDAAVLLPFVAFGIVLLLDKGRVAWIAIALALFMITCYTLWSALLIFSFAFFVWMSIICEDKVHISKALLQLVICFVLAVGCSMAVFLPSVFAASEISMAVRSVEQVPAVSVNQLMSSLFMGHTMTAGADTSLFCSCFSLIMLPLYFFNRQLDRSERQLGLFFIVFILSSMLLSELSFVFTSFSFPSALDLGISFIFPVIAVSLAARSFSKPQGINIINVLLSFSVVSVLYAGVIFSRGNDSDFILILFTVSFIILFSAVTMLLMTDRRPSAVFGIILMLCVFAEATAGGVFAVRAADSKSQLVALERYDNDAAYSSQAAKLIEENEKAAKRDGEFMRIRGSSKVINARDITSLNSIDTDSRFTPRSEEQLLNSLGISNGLGFTQFTDAFFSVRYIIEGVPVQNGYRPISAGENYALYENGNALSIGVLSDITAAVQEEFPANPFEAQNRLCSDILGKAVRIFEPCSMLAAEGSGAHTIEVVDGIEAARYSESATVDFSFLAQKTGKTYMYLDSTLSDYAVVTANGNLIADGSQPALGAVLCLGEYAYGEEISVNISMKEERVLIKSAVFVSLDEQAMEDALSEMKSREMQYVIVDGGNVKGTVEAKGTKILITSIPYSSSWKAYIDGVNVPPTELYGSFLGVEIPTGKHSVELRYSPDERLYGLLVSIIFALFTLLFIFASERQLRLDSMEQGIEPSIPDWQRRAMEREYARSNPMVQVQSRERVQEARRDTGGGYGAAAKGSREERRAAEPPEPEERREIRNRSLNIDLDFDDDDKWEL